MTMPDQNWPSTTDPNWFIIQWLTKISEQLEEIKELLKQISAK